MSEPTTGASPAHESDVPRPLPRSALVSAVSLTTGLGRLAQNLFDLGYFGEHVLFPIRRTDSSRGFTRIVRDPLNVAGSGALLSRHVPTRWGTYVEGFDYVHFTSPHFFHLADRPRCSTGTVADLFFLKEYDDQENPTTFRWYFRREMKYLRRLAAVVSISAATDTRLRALAPDVRSTVIHPWTDERFVPRDAREARTRLQLPTDKVLLLHVGDASRRKNLALLAQVMERLEPNCCLVRLGPPSPDDDRIPRGRLIRRDSVPDAAYPWYFNAADLLVQPSTAEGFGVPVIEAINSGTPIVASSIDVFREILGARYPYLAPADDVDRWVEQIREVLQAGRARSAAAFESWNGYYRPERGATEFGRLFHEVGVI
jgi:glycosyltransferase involved in cell wall biosynthesis